MRIPSSQRLSVLPAVALRLGVAAAAAVVLVTAGCGGGGSQTNPPPPDVEIDVVSEFVDVGQRYFLDGSRSTDPNGNSEDMTFQWRLVSGGLNTEFDDHCRDDFDEICDENADDTCTNDTDRICNSDSDCLNFGTCDRNSGTSSPDCTTGICGLEEGDQNVEATFVANVAGPYSVRLTAIGSQSNGTRTRVLNTYPSLYVVGSLVQFGGTGGANLGEVADAAEFAAGASEGTGNPNTGNLVVIDDSLGVIRTFDLLTGEVIGAFGDSDEFVDNPAAMAFRPDNGRLYVGQQDGDVRIFDGTTGLLVASFRNVGLAPRSMVFSPVTGDLLVVSGAPGSGIRVFGVNGSDKGILGDTDEDVDQPVDMAFTLEDEPSLLIADLAGRVVRCDADGTNCGQFSSEADNLLAPGSPSAVAVSPSSRYTDADVMIADPVGKRVLACDDEGEDCGTFGETDEIDSRFEDIFFAPSETPTTTTTTTSTTTTTLRN